MDYWNKPLTSLITPKSGPLPQMASLLDANRALIDKLPRGYLKRAHWLRAGQALLTAAETGESGDIEMAFEAIFEALSKEGWLSRGISITAPLRSKPPPSEPLRREPLRSGPPRFEPPRNVGASAGNVTPRRPAEPLWRRIRPVSKDRQSAEG